jgi:TRAP-type uncharacterized transport system substrate-binding protein
MAKTVRQTWLLLREMLTSAGPLVLLAIGLLVLAYVWLDPTPPKRVRLATGPAQSAYDAFGQRYAQALAAYGIEVQLLPSEGSAQNLQWLAQGKADLAFVQGGTRSQATPLDETMVSLGSLFVEPIWLFYRTQAAQKVTRNRTATLDALTHLKGLRVNVGSAGSGVPDLMHKLFEINHINPAAMTLTQLAQTPATVAFLGGDLDALVFASAPESLMVQMLLQTPGVKLMNFAQSEAYARRLAFLTPVTLPNGVVDLANNVPARDVRLVAPTTTLVAQSQVHPAVLQLFSQTALALHGRANWFSRANEFPNAGYADFPLAPEAQRILRDGISLMQRYLPFAYANVVERMWLALGIIVAVLLPLSRIVGPLYAFRIRSRVFRWYAQLRDIEERAASGHVPLKVLTQELNRLESQVGKITVPLSYADEVYTFKDHIELVRKRWAPAAAISGLTAGP